MRRTMCPWPISFHAEGLNMARFLRFAGEQGIRLSCVRRTGPRRVSGLVAEDQLPRLQELACRGGWQVTAGRRRGAGRAADWLRLRWLLVSAILCGLLALLLASGVMWRLEVQDGGAYAADLHTALADLGITPPMLRSQVDIGALRDALEWRYPRIAWIECGWRGTTLVIRPALGNLPLHSVPAEGPRDVVASRDGIVQRIVTAAGTPVVEAGDFVREGEVLIRGEERTADGQTRPVSARGRVTARVWRGASVCVPATETATTYTGRTQLVRTICTPWFDLWPMPEAEFARYDTSVSSMPFGGMFLPMTLRTETRMEAEISVQPRKQAEAEAEARAAAEQKLREMLSPDESLIDIWGNCSMIEDGKVCAVAIGEMLVEIGMQAPSDGMAASGQENPE